MDQPLNQPAPRRSRCRPRGGGASRDGQSHESNKKRTAHERLISKRCKSCQTLYQSAMGRAALAVFIGLTIASQGEAKTYSTIRVHAEADASNGPVFSTQLKFLGRMVTIEKVPTLSENDVTGFQTYRAADGTNGALFQLNDHGRLALDTVSVERRGGVLFVFINGRPITELRVDRRVSDGKIYIASGLTANDIELLKKDWPARK